MFYAIELFIFFILKKIDLHLQGFHGCKHTSYSYLKNREHLFKMTSLADIRRRPTTTFRVTLKQKLILLEFSLFF